MIDKLDAETVDEGKQHPFVVALMKELRAKYDTAVSDCVYASAHNTLTDGALRSRLGRASALLETMELIAKAKGRTE